MMQHKWKITKPSDWLGVVAIGVMVIVVTKCSIESVSLVTNWDYSIAHVTKAYRGGKMEHRISYQYSVKGKVYNSGAEWSEPIQVGDRFVVRYGKFAPKGNKPIYDLPIPDSIQQDTGRVWDKFLSRHNLL